MVEQKLPKLTTRVRFPSPAPRLGSLLPQIWLFFGSPLSRWLLRWRAESGPRVIHHSDRGSQGVFNRSSQTPRPDDRGYLLALLTGGRSAFQLPRRRHGSGFGKGVPPGWLLVGRLACSACSSASRTKAAVCVRLTRQPTIRLGDRNASIPDQPHILELELPAELPSLHPDSPVPKTLTRCPRNRQLLFDHRRGSYIR
jgi:hypothetical protein